MASIPTSLGERAFSLVELMVATTVIGTVLAAAGVFFVSSRDAMQQEILNVETAQALRATLDALQRDLRLSGACLTTIGSVVALSGTDAGTSDRIVTRTGIVSSSLTCVRTALSVAVSAGTATLPVQSTTGFASGMRVYVYNSTSGGGEFFTVTQVQSGALSLQCDNATSQAYQQYSGVYAVDERAYAVDTSNAALPILTLALNNGSPQAFAAGIESFNVRYTLARNCPACDVVDLPASNAEWMLVNEVSVSVTARSRVPGRNGQYYRRTGQVTLKPRNLLPGAAVLGS
jgi:prepilin-type N-terminal cleavage/methylation domain-containing protein